MICVVYIIFPFLFIVEVERKCAKSCLFTVSSREKNHTSVKSQKERTITEDSILWIDISLYLVHESLEDIKGYTEAVEKQPKFALNFIVRYRAC